MKKYILILIGLALVGGYFAFNKQGEVQQPDRQEPVRIVKVVVDEEEVRFGASEDVTPNATAAESGSDCTTSNAHTQMDNDPDGGTDSNLCNDNIATQGSGPDIRLNFNTPSFSPGDLTDGQAFAFLVTTAQNGGNAPTVQADLWCNGSEVETGSAQSIPAGSSTFTLLTESFTFDGGACASDGSDVEVRMICSASNNRHCDYDSVEWRADDTAAAGGAVVEVLQSVIYYDSD